MNVSICTPTTGVVKASYTTSLLGTMLHYLGTPVVGREKEDRALTYNLIIGSNISQQRDSMVEDSIEDPSCTHILFIDDDMGFSADCLNIALSRKVPVLLANYRRKAPPWPFTCRKLDDQMRAVEVITDADCGGLEKISFGGFGFCLLEADVLRQMKQPRFLVRWIEHQGLYSTEDYPFFEVLKGMNVPVYLDHDITKKVYHIGDFPFQPLVTPLGLKAKRAAEAQAA